MNTCITDFGKFRIQLDDTNINVGGKNFCVNIAISEKETTLYWLKTEEGGCELNGKDIRSNDTIKMTDLAFSILRKHHPERNKWITLMDDSGFTWRDRKRTYKTNFLKGYLLIHGKTWYEDKFNAVMCDEDSYRIYMKRKENFNNPDKKPEYFDFKNNELTELYKDSKTWREFIDKFIAKYDKDKYKMMYEWYRSAIYVIFEGMEINQYWKIDISNRQNIECKQNGRQNGGRKSRKKYHRLEPFSWNPVL